MKRKAGSKQAQIKCLINPNVNEQIHQQEQDTKQEAKHQDDAFRQTGQTHKTLEVIYTEQDAPGHNRAV